MLLFFMSQNAMRRSEEPGEFDPETEPALLQTSVDELQPSNLNPLLLSGQSEKRALRYTEA